MAEKKEKGKVKPVKKPKTREPRKKAAIKGTVTESIDFPIVGLGASAGGLEALELFFANMPANSGMAFVIIQHLSPTHKSMMGSLLMKSTQMKVVGIENGMKIEPDHIYLNPPDRNVVAENGRLLLMMPLKTGGLNLPIDCFFRSMAADLGEKAICIILSGTATDGTLGLKAVKGEGGIAMVQEPNTAKYDGMPRSAIATGVVDVILPVEMLPGKLLKVARAPYISNKPKPKSIDDRFKAYIQTIFALIRHSAGHDLSHYKHTTIHRRIERRMAVHQIDRIADYVTFLEKNPAEVDILFKDMLIGVTSFFRDVEAYRILEEEILPALLNSREPDSLLRIWIVGCSTGEEAYSLAILLLEVMDRVKKRQNFQIFASDIDAAAIGQARLGVYPDSIAADVSEERLRRYFVKEDSIYRIKKQIREMIVFAQHNVIMDPPFSKIDLVSCRNLLIYMDSPLQKKVLPLFHYTLRADGLLFLGTSESIGEFTDLFRPLDTKWKIFRKLELFSGKRGDYPAMPFYYSQGHPQSQPRAQMEQDIQSVAEKVILSNYALPGVLVNRQYDIIHFLGKTDRFLETPIGKASFNVLSMAREGLRTKLSTALNKAVKEKKTCSCEAVRVRHNDDIRIISLTVRPLLEVTTPGAFFLVMFDEKSRVSKTTPANGQKPIAGDPDPALTSLEQELDATREHLQTTIEELETSNEELKSANEELQSVNEELQSTNEELETSKEELQSTNEELVTVNTELQQRVNELSVAHNDINNLLASTEIGTVFLDIDLNIRRFTPAITKIFNLIVTDVGRSILDITASVPFDMLYADMQHVLETLEKTEREIQDRHGLWYSVRINAYRTIDNVIDGVVMTFTNITKVRQTEKLRLLATIVQDSNDAITVQDFEGRITAWNRGAMEMYGYSEADALKMNIGDIIPVENRAEMLALVQQVKTGKPVKPCQTERLTRDGRILKVWLTVTRLVDDNGTPVALATTERDITHLKPVSE
ncbi:PAS domain-containing protein [bacterium]|nr:PAS domain-containing protein [bacterium]